MKKIMIGLAVVAALGLGYYAFIYEPCKPPSELMVQMTQLGCAMNLINEDLRVEACRSLGREDNCDFVEEDRPAINALINRKVNECTVAQLKDKGYCTNTVKDL